MLPYQPQGPYLSATDAAQYCGGYSRRHFMRLVKEFHIPIKTGNRFAVRDLDTWMENKEAFRVIKRPAPRRNAGGFTPVAV